MSQINVYKEMPKTAQHFNLAKVNLGASLNHKLHCPESTLPIIAPIKGKTTRQASLDSHDSVVHSLVIPDDLTSSQQLDKTLSKFMTHTFVNTKPVFQAQ